MTTINATVACDSHNLGWIEGPLNPTMQVLSASLPNVDTGTIVEVHLSASARGSVYYSIVETTGGAKEIVPSTRVLMTDDTEIGAHLQDLPDLGHGLLVALHSLFEQVTEPPDCSATRISFFFGHGGEVRFLQTPNRTILVRPHCQPILLCRFLGHVVSSTLRDCAV
jgi:hypothetical protein